VLASIAAIALLTAAQPAAAVEYRLQVVSIYEGAFASFLRAGEWKDGVAGPGLDRLEASLDRGEVGRGNLLYDRHLQPVSEATARAFGGVTVPGPVLLGGDVQTWDEVRWDGKPGERSVWRVRPTSRLPQALTRTALKGTGPMRQFQPYTAPSGSLLDAVRIPLAYLTFGEERGTLWQKDLASRLDLSRGIGVVVGANDNVTFPDQVTLVVGQGADPTTFKAVLVWRLRNSEQQAPGDGNIIRIRHAH
jgi:hypothetical protein